MTMTLYGVQSRYWTLVYVEPLRIIGVGTIFLSLKTNRVLLQFRNSDKRQKHTWGF